MSYYEVLISEKCIKMKLIKTKYLPVGSEESTLIQSETISFPIDRCSCFKHKLTSISENKCIDLRMLRY